MESKITRMEKVYIQFSLEFSRTHSCFFTTFIIPNLIRKQTPCNIPIFLTINCNYTRKKSKIRERKFLEQQTPVMKINGAKKNTYLEKKRLIKCGKESHKSK